MTSEALDKGSTTETAGSVWLRQTPTPTRTLPDDVRRDWERVRSDLATLAGREGWTMMEVCRRSDVPVGTLSTWYDGKYTGRYQSITERVLTFLVAHEERKTVDAARLSEPLWVPTPIALQVMDALLIAQELPGIALVTLGPGMGKSTCVRHARKTRPHTYAITLSPSTRSVASITRAVAEAVDVSCPLHQMRAAIGSRLQRNGRRPLLIVDEAQNLSDESVQELRHYHDVYETGLALLGNEDVHTRWGSLKVREGYGQTHRRIDARVRQLRATAQDIDTYLEAFGIRDDGDMARLLRAIGSKPGSLGQISKTLRMASIRATGEGRDLTVDDVRWAWTHRSGEHL